LFTRRSVLLGPSFDIIGFSEILGAIIIRNLCGFESLGFVSAQAVIENSVAVRDIQINKEDDCHAVEEGSHVANDSKLLSALDQVYELLLSAPAGSYSPFLVKFPKIIEVINVVT
jgi:hypothetical protein